MCVFSLICLRMLSMVGFVRMQRGRMNALFLRARGAYRLGCGRIRRADNGGCECRRCQHDGRNQNGRDFPVHSHSSFRALVNWDRP